jgi:hypothetical protein
MRISPVNNADEIILPARLEGAYLADLYIAKDGDRIVLQLCQSRLLMTELKLSRQTAFEIMKYLQEVLFNV